LIPIFRSNPPPWLRRDRRYPETASLTGAGAKTS